MKLPDGQSTTAEALVRSIAAPGHVTVEVTWWAKDGTERRGWVNLAPDAPPEALIGLTQMLRAAEDHAWL